MRVKPHGFSLVELIVTSVIVGILALVTSAILISFINIMIYAPRQLKVKSIAGDILSAIIDGDSGRWGIRDAVSVHDATAAQFTYMTGYPANDDKRYVRFRWDGSDHRIYRSVSSLGADVVTPPDATFGAEEPLPYYAGSDVKVDGPSSAPSVIFSYYKSDGSSWTSSSPLTDIRRVDITCVVKTGNGEFGSYQGSYQVTSGVEVRQYI